MAETTQQQGSKVYQAIAFTFVGEKTAAGVLDEIVAQQKFEGYHVVAQAAVECDAKGKVHVHQPGRGGVGTALGAGVGGFLGLLGGPAGLLIWLVAGSAMGGVAGHFVGRQFDQDELKRLGDQLTPGSSALLALVEDVYTEGLIDSMKGYKANVVTITVGDQASGEIAQAVAAEVTAPGAAAGAAATPAPVDATATPAPEASAGGQSEQRPTTPG